MNDLQNKTLLTQPFSVTLILIFNYLLNISNSVISVNPKTHHHPKIAASFMLLFSRCRRISKHNLYFLFKTQFIFSNLIVYSILSYVLAEVITLFLKSKIKVYGLYSLFKHHPLFYIYSIFLYRVHVYISSINFLS